MSRRDKQTNKETQGQQKGRPTRAQRKSIIAAAIGLEDVQGVGAVEGVNATTSPQFSAPAQTSAFSAFGKDAARPDVEGFEGRHVNNYANIAPANEMTKQCSMVHRMEEKDKRDVDPRDLHKLLPSAMLTSESLDLRPDGKVVRGISGMDVHKVLEDQAMQFHAERKNGSPDHELSADVPRLSPTVEEHAHGSPDRHARSFSNQGLMSVEQPNPNSPVTGWPAAAVLGIMHPMNHTLSHIAKQHVSSPAELIATNPLIYSDSNTAMARLTGAPGSMLMDWNAYHSNGGPQIYSQTSYPTPSTQPVILEHPAQEEQYTVNYHQIASQASSNNVLQETSSSRESVSSSSEKDGSSDGASKKFKSLEAALAWCHVQHSQKQVPIVPKDDVRKLVDFQLNSGKPIRAPWYRPQGEKSENAKPVEKPVEKKPIVAPPRMRRPLNKVKKQGTGFFCPPGASLARV